jgi:hypothetical protein
MCERVLENGQVGDQDRNRETRLRPAVVRGREPAAYKYYAQEERRGVQQPPKVRPVLAQIRMCPESLSTLQALANWLAHLPGW